MAHELYRSEDGKYSMMYVDEVPWHGLGLQLAHPPTAAEGLVAAGLDWQVAKLPLFYFYEPGDMGTVPDHYAIVPGGGWRDRKRPVFGVVSAQYNPLQNSEAFAFFDPLIKRGQAIYEAAGALGNGERVWVLAKLKDPIEIKGDATERYLLLSNSHDGRSAVQIKITPIRVVCNNTLTMALSRGTDLRILHTEDLDERMEQATNLFAAIVREYADIEDSFRAMARRQLKPKEPEAYFKIVFPDPEKPEQKQRQPAYNAALRRARRDQICCANLFEGERNSGPGIRGTAWAAYNAVTEYVDHRNNPSGPARSESSRLASMWFGRGYGVKVRAYGEALKLCGVGVN